MELEEAIKEIKLWVDEFKEAVFLDFYNKRFLRAIDTVIAELDTQTECYEEGYRQGYNEGYLAGAMERI